MDQSCRAILARQKNLSRPKNSALSAAPRAMSGLWEARGAEGSAAAHEWYGRKSAAAAEMAAHVD